MKGNWLRSDNEYLRCEEFVVHLQRRLIGFLAFEMMGILEKNKEKQMILCCENIDMISVMG